MRRGKHELSVYWLAHEYAIPSLCPWMAADRRRAAAQALKKLGARIREIRTERGLSQEALAFESDVAVNSIATIERGEANPSVAVLLAISRVLKVKVRDLVDDI